MLNFGAKRLNEREIEDATYNWAWEEKQAGVDIMQNG
jgi:hypothetical protein